MRNRISSLAVGLALLWPAPAAAIVHLWKIVEVFSNADGSAQFVELFTDAPTEVGMSLGLVRSDANLADLDQDLVPPTTDHSFLLATPGFETLPGVAGVVPDFVIDPGFLAVDGDTIRFEATGFFLIDSLSFGPGELPTDGLLSLNRPFSSDQLSVGPNSPRNFAGVSGSIVPEPASALLLGTGLIALALGAGRGARAPGRDPRACSR